MQGLLVLTENKAADANCFEGWTHDRSLDHSTSAGLATPSALLIVQNSTNNDAANNDLTTLLDLTILIIVIVIATTIITMMMVIVNFYYYYYYHFCYYSYSYSEVLERERIAAVASESRAKRPLR